MVITIISTLIGLLLPAVQAAREAARRNTCSNNEHQLSLAMLNFESSHKSFPGLRSLMVGATQYNSWVFNLLPYLDRRDLYDNLQNVFTAAATRNAILPVYSLAVLLCPSDPAASTGPGTAWNAYVVNRGRNGWDTSPAVGVCFDQTVANASKVGMDYISTHDGASTTLLLSESPQNPVGGVVNTLPSTTPYLCVYKAAAEGGAPSTGTAYYYRPYPTWVNTRPSSVTTDTDELDLGFEWGSLPIPPTVNGSAVGTSGEVRNLLASRWRDDKHLILRWSSVRVESGYRLERFQTPDDPVRSRYLRSGASDAPTGVLDEGNL